jgi:hypothetical protein
VLGKEIHLSHCSCNQKKLVLHELQICHHVEYKTPKKYEKKDRNRRIGTEEYRKRRIGKEE